MSFVHLHLHTEYSLLDGVCRITELPEAVKAAGQTAVAITDHGVLYGAVAFYQACEQAGIRPIIGCEVYVAPRRMEDKTRLPDGDPTHLTLLVENRTGYENLMQIVSRSYTKGFFEVPRTDRETLEKYASGLIALSGCQNGGAARCLRNGDRSGAREWVLFLERAFGHGNFFLEICRHGKPGEREVNEGLVRFSEELGIPLVATNDVHYLRREDAVVQRMLWALRDATPFREDAFASEEQAYLKTEQEMRVLFSDLPEAIDNTERIAQRCCFALDFSDSHLPAFRTPDGSSASDYLQTLCRKGYEKRMERGHIHGGAVYEERIAYELSVIRKMGFSDYYLIVWDFVNYARKNNIPVGPGRGSGVGSLVAYCIGITDVDPIAYDLLFERFLNPERVSMPDFDLDFCKDRRYEVIAYATETYGKDHVAQIVTFGTMACRQALRDAGRVLELAGAVDGVLRLLPKDPNVTLQNALQESAQLRKHCAENADAQKLVRFALLLEGRPRNASTHASGVVITDKPLAKYVPLCTNDADSGVILTQYTMNAIGDLGLLKIDFLGSKNLTILHEAEALIRKKRPDFRVEEIPQDDKATYALLSAGHTLGLFQLEKDGMRNLLRRLRPQCLTDIVSVISLYRPGPMLSIDTFLKNRREPEKTVYPVPEAEPILKETYGCILYQEQVMLLCRRLAGFTLGHADMVRRAMAKKKQAEMEKEALAFLSGCAENGIRAQDAQTIFDLMKEFAKYAFNKSHAVAYAVFAYRTAYLKTHYPQEFLCALLNANGGAREKLPEYAAELSELGVHLLAPDINRSDAHFTTEGADGIRYGLSAVKNVGDLLAERIVSERNVGEFRSVEDLLTRIAPFAGARQLEALTRAGALDGLGAGRGSILAALESALDMLSRLRSSSSVGQMGMFDDPGQEGGALQMELSPQETLSLTDRLSAEKEYTGMYFSGHPLDKYAAYCRKHGVKTVREVYVGLSEGSIAPKQEVHLLGMITAKRVRLTKKNTTMAFVAAEDASGELELILFPDTFEKLGSQTIPGAVLELCGSVSLEDKRDPDGKPELKMILKNVSIPETNSDDGSAILSVEDGTPKPPSLYLQITRQNQGQTDQAIAACRAVPGRSRILVYFAEEKKLRAVREATCDPTPALLQTLKHLLGDGNVAVK